MNLSGRRRAEGLQIERKFLVDPSRVPAAAKTGGSRFAQGYLSLEPTVRVRRSERDDEPARPWITVKVPGGLSRAEFEYPIPADDATAMMDLCVAVLSKTRYRVPVGAHVWDLDAFDAPFPDLWLAEIELDRPDEHFTRPEWLGDEVTDDPRYSNAAIALAGHRRR